MSFVAILACGPAVTIQDGGRFGWEHCGVTQGGAVDAPAWRLGQRLIANPENSAAIEVPWGGIRLSFVDERRVAITGAPVPITLDGIVRNMNTGFSVSAGSTLALGRPTAGVWSYVSISGGIDTPLVFGSRTTVLREGLGGLNGKSLTAGSQVPLGVPSSGGCFSAPSRSQPSDAVLSLRLVTGFQFDQMSDDARATLLSSEYRVTARSDRMGVRLEGAAANTGISQLWSEGTCLGAVQIPPDGQPIVLLNDRQTMGGYPKAGAILSSDCARLAQLRAGDRIRFSVVSATEADRVRWLQDNYEQEQVLQPLHTSTRETRAQ